MRAEELQHTCDRSHTNLCGYLSLLSLSLCVYLQADHIEESVAYELMELMDLNGDGVIDFSEFCKGWLTFQSKFDADEAATAAAGN